MGTHALYTFKGDQARGERDLTMLVFSDGYPKGAANIIPELEGVVTRIRNGETIDLAKLELPHFSGTAVVKDWKECGAYSYRYEIMEADGQQVVIAYEHDRTVLKNLEERVESARTALEEAQAAMREAQMQPKYSEIFRGPLPELREFGENRD